MASPTAVQTPMTTADLDAPVTDTVGDDRHPDTPGREGGLGGPQPRHGRGRPGGAEQVAGFELPESAVTTTERLLDDPLAFPGIAGAFVGTLPTLPESVTVRTTGSRSPRPTSTRGGSTPRC